MIRQATPADTPTLVALGEGTEVFKPHEIVALREVLDDYHDGNFEEGHRCVVAENEGELLGFAYYAPAAMTDRTWYLYWIAVRKNVQSRGTGTALLSYVEEDIRRLRGRVLFIETSSLPHYDMTRRFYVKYQYDQEAVLRDFYADGDDMVVFRKQL